MPAAIHRVDHVVIFSSDAPALFALLAQTLALPIVWPMLSFGGYVSGGVSAGNLNLEVTPAAEPGAASMRGLVLAPEDMAGCLAELDRRGLPHTPPDDYKGDELRGTPDFDPATPPGTRLWSVAWLRELPGPGYAAVCDYNYQVLQPFSHYADVLRGLGGGPLGLTGVSEIVIGVSDLPAASERWQQWLDPAQPAAPGRWPVGDGPDIHLVAAERDGIQSLVFKVSSLERAEAFLRGAGLLGQAGPDGLSLAPERVQGLDIRLAL